jgi:hypothetical protein
MSQDINVVKYFQLVLLTRNHTMVASAQGGEWSGGGYDVIYMLLCSMVQKKTCFGNVW